MAPVIYGPSLARIAGYDRVSKRLIVRATGLAAVLLCASLFMRARASNVRFARTVWVSFVLLGSLGALVSVTFQNNSFARIPLCLVVFACASVVTADFHYSLPDNNMKMCEGNENPFCFPSTFWAGYEYFNSLIAMGVLAVGLYIFLGTVAYFKQNR